MDKIIDNHPDTIILKVKDHLISDISSAAIEMVISALWKNRVCQVLLYYVLYIRLVC